MKVLFLASYITILDDKAFTKNITGYGHMVRDIADHVSRLGVEVDIVTSSAITKGGKYKAVTILKRTWADILQHIKPYYMIKMVQLIKTYNPSKTRLIKMLYYSVSAGYVEHILKYGDYDLVHIHGIGFGTKPYIDSCERLGIRYVVTLHGLNSFSDSVKMESGEKLFEKDFLQYAYKNRIPLTVISTGILNVIKNYLNVTGNLSLFDWSIGLIRDNKEHLLGYYTGVSGTLLVYGFGAALLLFIMFYKMARYDDIKNISLIIAFVANFFAQNMLFNSWFLFYLIIYLGTCDKNAYNKNYIKIFKS